MNPLIDKLNPYPFERLRSLCQDIKPNLAYSHISLSIGEPKHPTPDFIKQALSENLGGLSEYPSTLGELGLRQACAAWVEQRFQAPINAQTQILPVNGSREALFALTQAVVNAQRSQAEQAIVVCPNPFYQIYEGAALLANAQVEFANSDPGRAFAIGWDQISAKTWARTQLLFVCTPDNPTGAIMSLDEWAQLFALSDKYGFVIASDECYSEIYAGSTPPLGALQAAIQLGRPDFRRLVMLTSLSKRSNVPGLRSGFIAGDAQILATFLRYRTYHGCAMSPVVQQASRAAWSDEDHVVINRQLYQEKFDQIMPLLAPHLSVVRPSAGFYLWANVERCAPGMDDITFARGLLAQYNVSVLPGSLLARTAHGINPGAGRIRLALVPQLPDCMQAIERLCAFAQELSLSSP